MSPGPVHFILTAGELRPQYRRGLESAAIHGAPVILWHTGQAPEVEVETRPLAIPSWLAGEHPAHIADPLLLQLLYEHGGMFLGLDTISIRPALDLLTKELAVSLDVPWADYVGSERHIDHPFSMHLIGEQGSYLIGELYDEACHRVKTWAPSQKRWGYTGPALLTSYVLSNLDRVDIPPFPTLCGWEGSFIWRYYLGLEQPSPETRVIHLFSSAYPELFAGDIDGWLRRHPEFRQHLTGTRSRSAQLLR